MEQSTFSRSRSKTKSYLSTLFSPEEIEVSQTLHDIPNLIQREFPSQFHVIWGGKRKRSAIDSSPSIEKKRPKEERETEKRLEVKVEALSPTTPFSFSPSESDEKSKLCFKLSLKKSSSKKRREEHLETIEELTQRSELLKGEIERVKSYYKKLEAINLGLKAQKRELEMCKKLGVKIEYVRGYNRAENQDYYYMLHQQPSNVDHQTAYGSQAIENSQQHPYGQISPFLSTGPGSGEVREMGPLCIPDLNVSASNEAFGVDSSQLLDLSRGLVVVELDDNKARAASEARRRRMIRLKEMKGSFASNKSLKCR